MASNILTIFPVIVLFVLSFLILYMAISGLRIYLSLREPIIIHGSFIILQLWLTFLTGAIGLFFELDQINHPIFQSNLLFLSLTYVGSGFIIQNIFINQKPILVDYNLLMLAMAPAYGLALILGAGFHPVIALLSQIIPLLSLTIFDWAIIRRIKDAQLSFNHQSELEIIEKLKQIFTFSMFIHGLGLVAMSVFSLLLLKGVDLEIKQIWVGTWHLFDYLYFIALLGLFFFFLQIARNMESIVSKMESVRLDKIINAIIT